MGNIHFNMSAPNLVNVCIDHYEDGEIGGRLYHCYAEQPRTFHNVIELLRVAEELYDTIGFPQASTKTRSLVEDKKCQQIRQKSTKKKCSQIEVSGHQGEKATFLLVVKFRQNSTWQGELFDIKKEIIHKFANTLELMKILDAELTKAER